MKRNSKITVAVNPSIQYLLFNVSADGTISYSIFEGKFLEVVMNALGMPYNLVFPEDGLVGDEISTGNWTGMMGIIQRDEADLAYTHLPINEQRNKLVDFSRFYSMEEYVFVSQYPEVKKSPLTLFYPFKINMWIGLLVTYIIVSLFLAKFMRGTRSIPGSLFHLFSSLVGQPLEIGEISLKCNILVTFWGFFTKIILFSYSSILLSFLIQPSKEPPIRTFSELSKAVHTRQHKVFFNDDSIHFLLSSNEKYLVDLGKYLSINNQKQYTAQLLSGELYNSGVSIGCSANSAKVFFGGKKSVYFSEENLYSTAIAFACNKKFCCRSRLNTIISRLSNAGIYEKVARDYSMKFHRTTLDDFIDAKTVTPLSMSDLFGTMVILSIGLILSFLAFLGEIIYFKSTYIRCLSTSLYA